MNIEPRALLVLFACALASACTTAPGPGAPGPVHYRAARNEPFWSVDVDQDRLLLKTPEALDGTGIPAVRSVDAGAVVFTQRPGSPAFTLRLTPGPCQDTMADRTWTHVASFVHGGRTLHGCGEAID